MACRRNKVQTCEEHLNNLTREDLILQIQRLNAHNNQLKNVISKNIGDKKYSENNTGKKQFDFNKCPKRHIFLKILYLGWDYQGYATQEDTNKTIEWELFQALKKSCLVEDRTTSNYHRCGRTDKGVSAFGQVISIDIRSKISQNPNLGNEACGYSTGSTKEGENLESGEACSQTLQAPQFIEETQGELDYCKVLNRVLPTSIRAIAWSPAKPQESARFNCINRTYKYFFPRGNLNIQKMVTAAEHLVGEHDFRNLCKMDVGNGVTNFKRKILSVSIKVLSSAQLGTCTRSTHLAGKSHASETYYHRHASDGAHGDRKSSKKMGTNESPSKEIVDHVNSERVDSGRDDTDGLADSSVSSIVKCVDRDDGKEQGALSDEVSDGNQSKEDMYDMCELTVIGQAFLWHQIRCIMTVLFLVGQGKEDPSVVQHLLDVANFPRKPQYSLASEIPLNLFASDFESTLNWVYDRASIFSIIRDLQKEWTMLSVRATMIRQILSELGNEYNDDLDASELTHCLLKGIRPRSYVPLLKRETCESLEERIDHYVKKRRIDPPEVSEK